MINKILFDVSLTNDHKADISLVFTILELFDHIKSFALWGWAIDSERSEVLLDVSVFLGLFRLCDRFFPR